ncbi:hypothetical protein [Polyangium spumosum]|uniref:hypothetical protein n=1 Tax=Polyangium spumosum TaxID=889282 RepID=UPI001478EADC|nr:hypothetical protein [Polyangium spumosum]
MSVLVSGSAVGPRPLRRVAVARRGRAWALLVVSASILVLAYGCVSPDRPFGDGPPDGGAGGGAGQGGGAIGEPCSDGGACGSGFCVDGVCCESACAGTCEACNAGATGQLNGTCAPVSAGIDPESECEDEGAASCGRNGSCDGIGACALYAAGTECAAQTCVGQTKTLAKTCDGAGTCVDMGAVDCAPSACVGIHCATDCGSDGDCAPGKYCDVASGQCLDKKPIGEACPANKPNQCESGFCADGVCCDAACEGACEACSAARTGATDGACAPIPDGADPDGECPELGASSCGTDGACDGAGACRFHAAGTVCAAGSCAGGVRTNPDTCDGMGSCVDQGTTSCAPFTCSGNECASACTLDAQCAQGSYCAAGACVTKKSAGASCSGANQCASGFCVDGVCCSSSCTGVCQACSVAKKGAGTNGACGPITGGLDPDNECSLQAPSTCGTTGFCSGAGACQLYPSGTTCAAAGCTNDVETAADTCNGTGACIDNGTKSCSPYVCGTTSCKTSCELDTDCVAGHVCSAGVCALPITKPGGSR